MTYRNARAAAQDAFRVALADALRPLSDPVAIKAQASRLLAERLGANRVLYFEVRDSDYVVESDYTRGVPSVAGTHPVDSFGPALLATLRAGQTVVFLDIETEPTLSDEERAAYRAIQIGAQVNVPLVKDGRFVAGLAVHSVGQRNWLPAEVAMAEECAERTWAAVERARAEREQRASDERYRKLFESIDEGFCLAQVILDETGAPRDYRFLEANAAFEHHTSLVDAVGKTARELIPDLEEFWVRTYGTVALTGESVRFENHASAMQRYFDVYCSRIGRPEELKVAIVFQDITQRKRAELALRESEERFRALAAMSSDWYWEQDEHFRYIHMSDEAEVRAGVQAASHIGKTRWELPHAGVSEAQWAEHRALLERHEPFRGFAYQRINERGDVVWVSASGDPVFDADGRFKGYRGTGTNITERKKDEEALRDADQRKDEFIATLSHELRNPLAPLRNGLELLRMQGANGAQAPILEMMERQLNQLVRLVDDLLEISRVSRGAFELRNERVELAAVVTNALETSDPLIKGARHELCVSLPEKPLWIEGDPVRLAQIVANLLNNAAKYTAPGGRIEVSAEEKDGWAKVSVADNGDGIAADLLPGLFEIFSGGRKPSGRDVGGGLGVGMAISRRLAEMHGGTLSVTSEGPGKGSKFALRLPLAADAGAAKTRTEPVSAAALLQQRILVVDDNHDAAESMRIILSSLGADVQVANDGPQALDAFETYHPAVVILDIGMPGMDGYEVARIIRAKHPDRHAAIIALTGWGREEDRRKSRESGFDHHLVKPADIGALRALLSTLQ